MEQEAGHTPLRSGSPTRYSRVSEILERAKLFILNPMSGWEQVAKESTPVPDLFRNYVIPLAAITPVCEFLRMWLFGSEVLGITVRWGFFSGLTNAVFTLVMSLIGMYVIAAVIRFVAAKQQVSVSHERSFQLIAYAYTPAFVSGVFWLIPGLTLLGTFFGVLYSLYLFYVGIPQLTSAAPERQKPFFVLTLVGSFVVMFVLSLILAVVAPKHLRHSNLQFDNVQVPGGGKIDFKQLQKAAEEAEKAFK